MTVQRIPLSRAFIDYLIPKPEEGFLRESTSTTNTKTIEPESKKTENLSMSNANNTPIYGLPSIVDSFIRGIGRFAETKIEHSLYRIGFRFATEIGRYSSSRALLNFFQEKEITSELLTTAVKKSLEITLGTAIIDPNRRTDKYERMGTGFLNMVARLGSRVGLVGSGILKSNQFNFKTLADEFSSRTFCRLLFVDSDNPLMGIACRTVEQFAINEWVRNLPIYNLLLAKLSYNGKPLLKTAE